MGPCGVFTPLLPSVQVSKRQMFEFCIKGRPGSSVHTQDNQTKTLRERQMPREEKHLAFGRVKTLIAPLQCSTRPKTLMPGTTIWIVKTKALGTRGRSLFTSPVLGTSMSLRRPTTLRERQP